MAQQNSSAAVEGGSPSSRPELAFLDLTDEMLARLRGYGCEEVYPRGTLLRQMRPKLPET